MGRIEIVASNSNRMRQLTYKQREQLRTESPLKMVVNNEGLGIPIYVKVNFSVVSPMALGESIKDTHDAIGAVRAVYDELPFTLRHNDPLDGELRIRHVQPLYNGGSYRIDACAGLMGLRLTDMDDIVRRMGQATRAALAFCDAWESRGWNAQNEVLLVRDLKHRPPSWLVDGCAAHRFRISMVEGPVRDYP